MYNRLLPFLILLLLTSCASSRKLVYFDDLSNLTNYTEEVKNKVDIQIQPDDMLSITVSSLSAESNTLFNNGVLQSIGSAGGGSATSRLTEGYLVDKQGNINFPVLGKVAVAGLTKEQATEKMTAEISKSVKRPIINIRLQNFKITVIGEVAHPATFTVPNDRVNLIEAIGLAGDLTTFGKRENILIIREKDGVRSATRVNLTSKAILDSPYFYLQQNDIVYVEPAKAKSFQSSSTPFYLSTASVVLSIISILVFALR
ncbi:MAG: sugar transporter [Hymenobacter sp.]|nr:MAG: sugar transporter [Hymenobacter sp.]